jgi:hypothetical protein
MENEGLARAANALGKLSGGSVQPQSGTAKDLEVKNQNIADYKASTPIEPPIARTTREPRTAPVDRVRPGGKFGDRPGEKRIDVSGMLKNLPSYEEGIDEVPEDGPAILHKGEKVVSADENQPQDTPKESAGTKRVSKTLGGAKAKDKKKKLAAHKGTKKKASKIVARHATSGGIILEHHFDSGKPELHHHPDLDSAVEQFKEHMSDAPSAPEPNGPGAGAATGMAQPSSFKDGGVVQKSGMAMVHKGEEIKTAPKAGAKAPAKKGSYIGDPLEMQPKAEPEVDKDDKGVDNQGKRVVDGPDGNSKSGRSTKETGVASVVWGNNKPA